MTTKTETDRYPRGFWIPSLYFAEGIPYVVVMMVSVIMYKRLDVSNTDIALYTSWLYLPWVIKPFWSPFVDLLKTKRFWILSMQLLIGAGLAGVAFTIPTTGFLQASLAFLWLLAFSSATHDIAADGFYMIGLTTHEQAWWVGIRSTFYRLAMITGQGVLVMLAGIMEERTGNIPYAWSITFYVLAGVFGLLFLYHRFVLPRPKGDAPGVEGGVREILGGFVETFASFFKQKHIGLIVAFLLLFRFAEAQLVKLASPFLLDDAAVGGLGLSTTDVGFVYGTVGVAMLTVGGIVGGFLAAKHGLKRWLIWMVVAMNLPNAAYLFLAWFMPDNFWVVNLAVAVEQFGYGFGFTAYMLYMIYVSQGEHETAHYSICTGLMALGMMLPGMFSGWLQELIGYQPFFVWVMIATVPSFIVAFLIPLDESFGRKEESESE